MKLFEAKKYLVNKERNLGIDHLSTNTKNVYAFIADQQDTSISKIARHSFFDSISISTIKRSVRLLEYENFIQIKPCLVDTRHRLINIKP
jgi:DNA-binding MarR family transcriptional regulator